MNIHQTNFKPLLIIFFILSLINCGGGSSSSDDGGGDNTPPVDQDIIPTPVSTFNKARSFNGTVRIVVAATDSSNDMYVAGDFTTYNSSPVNQLVRLNADGTIDTSFNTGSGVNVSIESLALAKDGSGDIYVSGNFSSFNDTPVRGIVRLNSDGSIDTGFTINTAYFYLAEHMLVAGDGSGDIYLAGSINDTAPSTTQLRRLNSDGSIDTAFNTGSTGIDGDIYSLALVDDTSASIYVGGRLNNINGTVVNNLIRLNTDGTLDTSLNTGSGFDNAILTIEHALDNSGDIFVGGLFSTYNAASANRVLRLNADGTVDTSFTISSDFIGIARDIELLDDGSGDIYIGGSFVSNSNGAGRGIIHLNADGSQDTAFNIGEGVNGDVYSIAIIPGTATTIYAAGDFTVFNTIPLNHFARINSNGSLVDLSFTGTGFNHGSSGGYVTGIISARDGSGDIYVGGYFSTYNGELANGLIRLNSDGSIDTAFNTGAGFDSIVLSLAAATDGSGDIYVGGFFTRYNGINISRLVRLNFDGSLDTGFNIGDGLNSGVRSIVIANDNSNDVYIGGDFSTYNLTETARGIARLNSNGSLDTAFNSGSGFLITNGNLDTTLVYSIALTNDSSGDIYVGGNFNEYNTSISNRLVRLNNNGSIDPNFVTSNGFTNKVNSLLLSDDSSGDLYVGGTLGDYKGTTINGGLMRLNADGSHDTLFDTTANSLGGQAFSLALATDNSGDLYAGGQFWLNNNYLLNSNLIRFNANGSLNTTPDFGNDFNAYINAVAVSADSSNDVFAGGAFTSYKSTTVDRIVRLDPAGAVK